MRGQCDVEHRITVLCGTCGNVLECDGATDSIEVEPCQVCLKEAFEEGQKEAE
jgi:hypothetical protein